MLSDRTYTLGRIEMMRTKTNQNGHTHTRTRTLKTLENEYQWEV